ncbi:hypothetical protein PSI15_14675 [Xenorhabdus sp. PR6a]|uniref:hypothetical protein n=1 Tax=Xenorhabdus sp. PR6a TaxID=3025877 RepID=UPI0023595BAF|nr:hypothetical protein [Xenorhabdus sp. PR6a]MDC9582795.1 hypothetical protein [Xenorhabdus sp. PR6a]
MANSDLYRESFDINQMNDALNIALKNPKHWETLDELFHQVNVLMENPNFDWEIKGPILENLGSKYNSLSKRKVLSMLLNDGFSEVIKQEKQR